MVFFERHPERNGRLISRNEPNFSALSTEWLTIRDQIVRPLLSSSWTPEPSPQPDYGVIQPAPVLGTCTSPWPPSTLAKLRQRIVEAALAERSRWSDGTIKETDPRARARLIEIWKVGVGLGATQAAGYVDQRIPWSAAFISWVMKTAGAGDAFRYSASHREYIKASKTNRESGSCNPFKLFRLNERKPQVGDIVVNQYFGCTNPGVPGYDTPDKGCSHCDIIVKVEPGKITRIGGNLSDSVGLRTAATDSRGYIIPGIGSEPCWGIIKIE
jgi:hypothetical protein